MRYIITVDTGLSDCLAAREAALDAAVDIAQDLGWVLDAGGTRVKVEQMPSGPAHAYVPKSLLAKWEIPLTDSENEGKVGS